MFICNRYINSFFYTVLIFNSECHLLYNNDIALSHAFLSLSLQEEKGWKRKKGSSKGVILGLMETRKKKTKFLILE